MPNQKSSKFESTTDALFVEDRVPIYAVSTCVGSVFVIWPAKLKSLALRSLRGREVV